MSADEDRGSEESELESEFQALELEIGYSPYSIKHTWEGREITQPIDREGQEIWCVKFSPSGESIACVGEGILKVWDAAGRLESDLGSSEVICYSEVDWSKDGNLLVSGAVDYLKVWNINTWRCVKDFEHYTVYSAKFSPDGSVILSGSDDSTAKIWNVETGECLITLDRDGQAVEQVNFNHDGTLFTLASGPDCLMYDFRTLDVVQDFTRETVGIAYAKFLPDSRYMLFSMLYGSISLYDMRKQKVAGTYKGNTDADEPSANNFSFTTSGKYIVRGSADNLIYIWEANAQELYQVLGVVGHSNAVDSVDCHPDNNIIVSGSSDSLIKTWETLW